MAILSNIDGGGGVPPPLFIILPIELRYDSMIHVPRSTFHGQTTKNKLDLILEWEVKKQKNALKNINTHYSLELRSIFL